MHVRIAVSLLLVAVAGAGCSRNRYKVPSAAMFPTIAIDSHVTADATVKVPARGDIFVFEYPENPKQSFVKRIVGLPGDVVDIHGNVLRINGVALRTCPIGVARYTDDDGTTHTGDMLLESNAAGVAYVVFYDKSGGHDGSWTVKPGTYFAMGDNRNNSHDSRMWFGMMGGGVPLDLLQGRVESPKLALPKDAASLEPALAKCKSDLGVSG
jgi:signal peptidase I